MQKVRTCTFGENPETRIIEEEDNNDAQINLMEYLDEEKDVDQDVDELYFGLHGWDNLFEDFTV